MKRRTAIAVAVAACLAAPTAAQADSIVYLKGGDVWLAEGDGSGQYQVTTGGGYGSPSQADDGTIVARHHEEIVRMKQNGTVLSRFDPPDTTDSAGQHVGGVPASVTVSPDGSKVAYTYSHANCPVGVSCGVRYVTAYSHSDRATPVETFGKLYRRSPSWVSNDRLLAFNGYLEQVNYDSPGGGDDSDVHWFDDHEMFDPSTDLGDGELSRQGDRFAAVRGYGPSTHLMIYKVTENVISGTPSGPPAYACNTGEEETLAGPSWSPDGRALAFAHKEGIETIPLPSVEEGCPGASSGRVIVPGASEPDWGPAPVNPGPRDQQACTSCGQGDQSKAATRLKLRMPKRVSARALRRGLVLRVTTPGAGSLSASASLGRKRVASGRGKARAAGAAKVRLRAAKRSARRIKKGKRVTLKVAFRPAGGGKAQTAKATVRLGR